MKGIWKEKYVFSMIIFSVAEKNIKGHLDK